MSAILFEQTSRTLTRELQRWNRRLRLVRSVLWGPRGIMAGLALGVAAALISRVRPWLLPEQIAWATGLLTLGILLALLGWLWLRPQPAQRTARYFDRQFALKERTSTALQLTDGTIPTPPALVERQLDDAVRSAQAVNVAARLPVRVRWLELAAMVALGVVFAALLLTYNPQTQQLRTERELERAIADQAASLERQLEAIDRNTALTPEEREALRQPLAEALETLQQPEISRQEAIAALSEAQQKLRAMSNGLLREEQQTYREAARSLAGAETTSELAEALNEPDLGAAADAAEQAARELDPEMSAAEREDLAERLEQAAEALAESNPALAEQLREAAEALREGDIEAAQEALRDAAESLREQQEQLEQSAVAEQAEGAADEARAGQQRIAQAGQESSTEPQAQAGQQSEQTGAQAQPGQQAQPGNQGEPGDQDQQAQQRAEQLGADEDGALSSAESGQPGERGEGQSAGEGQPNAEGEAAEAQSPGAAQPEGEEGGEAAGQTGPLGGPLDELPGGGATGEEEAGQDAQAPGADQRAAPSAGQGEGGAGVDTTQGQPAPPGEMPPGGGDSSGAELRPFDSPYAPSTIGGTSDTPIDVGGQLSSENSIPSQEGDFAENPAGESRLAYQSVLGDYEGFISDALESGRIPLAQRDVIHDYFLSLEP